MARTHYEVDEGLKPARDLMDTLRSLRAAWDAYQNVRGCLVNQKDGSADNATDFVTIAANYGYTASNGATVSANARASFLEIDTAFTAADAAITGMLNKHLTK